jgi:hypothetical protein
MSSARILERIVKKEGYKKKNTIQVSLLHLPINCSAADWPIRGLDQDSY